MNKVKISKLLLAISFCIASTCLASAAPKAPQMSAKQAPIYVACMHDLGRDASNSMTIDPKTLENHINKLRKEGYTFLSLKDYVAICKQERPAPEKAIMLTFDDGYASFYQKIYPIVKQEKVPVLMSVIGSWMDKGAGSGIKMSTWQQLKEMEASGLVTIGCHSYDLHKPVPVNEWGEQTYSVNARIYANGHYETEEAYKERLAFDFAKSQKLMEEKLGHKVEAFVWPFGLYTEEGIKLGQQAGFKYFFQLGDDNYNIPSAENLANGDSLLRIRRILIYKNTPTKELLNFMRGESQSKKVAFPLVKVDVSQLYVPNNESQTLNNIDQFLNRFDITPKSVVVLNLAVDTNHDGKVDSVYFYNEAGIPVVKNIAQHIAGRINVGGCLVFGYIPKLQEWGDKPYADMEAGTLQKIHQLYNDFTVYVPNNGLYFDQSFLGEAFNAKEGNVKLADVQKLLTLTDELRTDNRAWRTKFNKTIAAVPVALAKDPQLLQELSNHYDFLQFNVEPGLSNFAAWRETPLANLPTNKTLQDSLLFTFATFNQSAGTWYRSEDIRPYGNYLYKQGFKFFGFNYDAEMPAERWYLPNMVFTENDVFKMYKK